MLNKYFDAAHFRVVDKPMDQQTLFAELCQQLLEEGFVDAEFMLRRWNVKRSSAPCWGMALRCRTPWAAGEKDGGLYRYRPAGHRLGDETAHLIFLLAISKREYEEAMAIYRYFRDFPARARHESPRRDPQLR